MRFDKLTVEQEESALAYETLRALAEISPPVRKLAGNVSKAVARGQHCQDLDPLTYRILNGQLLPPNGPYPLFLLNPWEEVGCPEFYPSTEFFDLVRNPTGSALAIGPTKGDVGLPEFVGVIGIHSGRSRGEIESDFCRWLDANLETVKAHGRSVGRPKGATRTARTELMCLAALRQRSGARTRRILKDQPGEFGRHLSGTWDKSTVADRAKDAAARLGRLQLEAEDFLSGKK